MFFKDYFKDTDTIQQQETQKKQQSQALYDFYQEYATEKLDNYNKQANISIRVQGFNFVDNCMDKFGMMDIYGPKCFDGASVTLMLLHSKKVAQIWRTHTFIDGKEVEPLKFNYWKPLVESYKKHYQMLDSKY